MKKTISVLTCKRVDYTRQVLEHIFDCKGVESWEVHVYQDIPRKDFYKNSLHASRVVPELTAMIKRFPITSFKRYDSHMGLKKATQASLKDIFQNKKSDINLHIEDDVLVAKDALCFVEQAYDFLKGNVCSVTLCGELSDKDRTVEERAKASIRKWFTCGWGWAIRKEFYYEHFVNAKDQGIYNSWSTDINKMFLSNEFFELFSIARKSKNIGRDFQTNVVNYDNGLNCKDVKDNWNNGKHGNIFNYNFAELAEKEVEDGV